MLSPVRSVGVGTQPAHSPSSAASGSSSDPQPCGGSLAPDADMCISAISRVQGNLAVLVGGVARQRQS